MAWGRGQAEREAAPVSMADTATAAAVRGEERARAGRRSAGLRLSRASRVFFK